MGTDYVDSEPLPDMETRLPDNHKPGFLARRLRLTGLRGKLIIPYVILTLLLAAVGTYVVTRLVTSSIRERFENQIYEASRVAADNIIRREQTHLINLRLMAFSQGVPEAFASRDTATLQSVFFTLADNNKTEIVTAIGLDSQELMTLGLNPTSGQYLLTSGRDFSTFEPVQNVLKGVVDQRGDKFVGLLDTKYGPALFTTAPVHNASGQLVGVLMIGTHLDTLIAETKTQSLADIIILDLNRKLIATTLAKTEQRDKVLEESAQDPGGPNTPQTRDISLPERDYQVYYKPLVARQQTFGWLGVALPSTFVVGTEATSRDTLSIIFALGTIGVILIGYFLSQSIARPILKLRSMSQAVAAGDLDQNTGVRRSDEIGELASAFDQMTLHLRERTAEAARLYAETVQRNKELAEINAQLQATQLQLIQSEKLAAIGQLTAGIVHDVKNPLTVIKGMAELLQEEEGLPASIKEELNVIRESAVKANRIVTDLLKFARQSTPEMKHQDMRETVEAALRLTAYLTREAHIQVKADLPGEPVMVTYDSRQVEQVLLNLIHNSVQAMPNRGSLLVNMSKADGAVAIAIQDTGVGIPPENLSRIFDPFFTTKAESEGTGLGLSLSYGIIANHRGRIDVVSEVGKGTTFTILLPDEQPVLLVGEK